MSPPGLPLHRAGGWMVRSLQEAQAEAPPDSELVGTGLLPLKPTRCPNRAPPHPASCQTGSYHHVFLSL